MINLVGYQISQEIHQSGNSIVYRGYRESDNLPVRIKVLRQNYPTPTQLTRYKQEYQKEFLQIAIAITKALLFLRNYMVEK
jgi:hypothetical protein